MKNQKNRLVSHQIEMIEQKTSDNLSFSFVGKNDRYCLQYLIDEGSFGQVYRACDTRDKSKKYAIKVQQANSRGCAILHQCRIYRCLLDKRQGVQARRFVPQIFYCAKQDDHNFLVMELMGPSLKELLFLKQTKIAVNAPMKFQMKTVLLLAEQMISAVEFIHSKGIVHRDLKPANFCVGLGAMKNQVFLLDFGLAKRYIVNGKHIPEGKISGMIGNRTYASIGCHRLCQQSRKDDLQSLGYILIDFASGNLPWKKPNSMNTKLRTEAIGLHKSKVQVSSLCAGLHQSFSCYMLAVRSLRFQEQPNYQFYKNLFRFALADLEIEGDELWE